MKQDNKHFFNLMADDRKTKSVGFLFFTDTQRF